MMGLRFILLFNAISVISCQNPVLYYSVTEEQASLQLQADIRNDSGILSSISSPQALNNLQFKIAGQEDSGDKFMVDERTGMLGTNGQLDRDAICPGTPQCSVALDISALSPPNFFQIIKINITIDDINDNSPRFSSNSSSISIPEATQAGFQFPIPKATDIDSPDYGIKGYRVIDGPVEFSLNVTKDEQQNIHPFIKLEQLLDRERRDSYNLDIEVFDSTIESTANIAQLSLKIDVLDANDNAPRFEQTIYRRTIFEDFNISDIVMQVHAIDNDLGDNGLLMYHFDSLTQNRYGSKFTLDEHSGDITLNTALDYEIEKSIELIITATEKNPNNIPATATVSLTIGDINDNIPTITVESIAGSYGNIDISENIEAGAFLAHISVIDKDSGQGGVVTCELLEEDDAINVFRLEEILENNYRLSTNTNLDHEVRTQYAIQVRCSDNGEPVLSSLYTATVLVLDENDHPPVLRQSQFTVALEENNEIGVELVQLNATDLDSGRNSEVVYQVQSGARNYINVDPYSGRITARMSFDYEQVQLLSYIIIAYDQGIDIKHTATATVMINITDQNDRAPVFLQPQYTMSVEENKHSGEEVGQVEAFDNDSSMYNAFFYEFLHIFDGISHFDIDPHSGKIFTKDVLDRELKESYLLSIRAFDKLDPSLFSIANVTVIVLDTNDHAPYIIFPNADNHTVNFNPDSNKHTIAKINAIDRDLGQNAKLSYHLLTGDEDNVFFLDETSGVLFAQNFDKIAEKSRYTLSILVRDNGITPLSNETWLYVSIVEESTFLPSNAIILTIIGVISGVIIICLIIAIVILLRRYRSANKQHKGLEASRPNLHYTLQSSNGTHSANSSPALERSAEIGSGTTNIPWDENGVDGLSQGSNDIQIRYHTPLPGQQYQQVVYGCEADSVSVSSIGDSGRGSHVSHNTATAPTAPVHSYGSPISATPDLLETTWGDTSNSRTYPRGMLSFRAKPQDNKTAKVVPRLRYTSDDTDTQMYSTRSGQSNERQIADQDMNLELDDRYAQSRPSMHTYSTFGKKQNNSNSIDIDKSKFHVHHKIANNKSGVLESGC